MYRKMIFIVKIVKDSQWLQGLLSHQHRSEIEFSTMALNIHLKLNFCTIFTSQAQPLKEHRAKKEKYESSVIFHIHLHSARDMRSLWIQNQHAIFLLLGFSSPLGWSTPNTKKSWNEFLIFILYQKDISYVKITTLNPRRVWRKILCFVTVLTNLSDAT